MGFETLRSKFSESKLWEPTMRPPGSKNKMLRRWIMSADRAAARLEISTLRMIIIIIIIIIITIMIIMIIIIIVLILIMIIIITIARLEKSTLRCSGIGDAPPGTGYHYLYYYYMFMFISSCSSNSSSSSSSRSCSSSNNNYYYDRSSSNNSSSRLLQDWGTLCQAPGSQSPSGEIKHVEMVWLLKRKRNIRKERQRKETRKHNKH